MTAKCHSCQSLFLAVVSLFAVGLLFGVVLNILQMEYEANLFPKHVAAFLDANWWLIFVCGLAGVYFGMCYQALERLLGLEEPERDLPLTIRSATMFLGLNHLTTRITFSNDVHFLLILLIFCLIFWFWFDKTMYGLVLSLFNALTVIVIVHVLRHAQLIAYTDVQFNYLQMCLLGLIFSGGILFANVGRLVDFRETVKHEHAE